MPLHMERTINAEPLEPRLTELRSQELTVAAYYRMLKRRFEAIEPTIQAFVEGSPQWESVQHRCRTLERGYNPKMSSLFGVPVGIKDLFHVNGLPTRAGSTLPPATLTGEEGSVIQSLRKAGAVPLGKTVTAEFAYFSPGPTRNPHALSHTPGGSSSGSAAAVAAGLCPIAIGTQTIGSIGRPAAFCGVVGMKPSYDRIPTDGVIDAAPSVDHVGYFTQDVAGARAAGPVLYADWHSTTSSDKPVLGAVKGSYFDQADPVAKMHFESHLSRLADAGYTISRVDPFEDIATVNRRHQRLVAAEMAISHSDWYPEYRDQYAPETAELIENGRDQPISVLADARRHRHTLRARLHEQLEAAGLDLFVSPAAPGPAPAGLSSTGDPIMNLPWTHAGLPTVVLPASRTEESLPMGLQCTARYGEDEQLLADAIKLQRAVAP